MPIHDIKITALEALKPLMTRSFTKSSLTVIMYLRAFDKPQPQFSSDEIRISKLPANDKNLSRKVTSSVEKNVRCKYKFTNVVLSLC